MEIDNYTLLAYFIAWSIFYFFLSHYIAELSRKRWTKWVESEESDETLMNALEVIVNEIEDRMHDKLEAFQKSFFGSVGAMTQKAKNLDPMNGIRKAAKDGDWASMLVEYAANKANLGHLVAQNGPKQAQNGPKTAQNRPKLGLK
jgi:hypothetical protein